MQPPGHITLDLDAFDDPAHGAQQLIMFHGYYGEYQYLPIVITCAENDMVLLVGLRHGTCSATLGVDNDLRYVVGRLRAVWPDVHIHVRADSGFGVPMMYNVCQELRLSYTFGIGMNSRLRDISDELLKQAVKDFEKTKEPQRRFLAVHYKARSWACRSADRYQGRSARPGDQPAGRGYKSTGVGRQCRRRSTRSTPSGAKVRIGTRN